MKNNLVTLIVAATLLTATRGVQAEHNYNDSYRYDTYEYDDVGYEDDEYDDKAYAPVVGRIDRGEPVALSHQAVHYARVVDVEPVVRSVEVRRPVQECWNERVSYYDDRHDRRGRRNSAPATVAGGVIGGVIGRQFGGGRGRDAMTVIGTLVGSAIANERVNRDNYRGRRGHRHVESQRRCETTDRVEYQDRIDGYEVTYLYNDRHYTTRTDEHPGDRIAVQVNVTPMTRY